MLTGTIRDFYNGYGFIVCDACPGRKVFLYYRNIQDHWGTSSGNNFAMKGEEVRFEWEEAEKGPRATTAEIISLRSNILHAQIVSVNCETDPREKSFSVRFAWLGEYHTRRLRLKYVIPGLDGRPIEQYQAGDCLLAQAYIDANGGLRIGHSCGPSHQYLMAHEQSYIERNLITPRVEHDASGQVTKIDGFKPLAGPTKTPNPIILSLPTLLYGTRFNARATSFYRIDGKWYVTLPFPQEANSP